MRHPVRFAVLLASLSITTPIAAQSTQPQNTPSIRTSASPDSSQITADTTSRGEMVFAAAAFAPIAPAAPSSDVAPSTTNAGAPLTGLRAGVHARETSRPNQPLVVAEHQHVGQDAAMMIVGAAALVAGAIIGGTPGTIVMVGGAVVGLVGLYNYLQ